MNGACGAGIKQKGQPPCESRPFSVAKALAASIQHFGAPLAEHVAAGDQKVDQTLLGHAASQINVQLQLEQISVFGALFVVGAREADAAMPLVDALKQRGLVFVAALKARLKSDDAPAFGHEQVGGIAIHLPEQVAVFVKGAGIALFAGQVHELPRADLGNDKGHVVNDGRDGIGQLAVRQMVCHGDLSLGLRSQGLECTAGGRSARQCTPFRLYHDRPVIASARRLGHCAQLFFAPVDKQSASEIAGQYDVPAEQTRDNFRRNYNPGRGGICRAARLGWKGDEYI